MPRQTILVLSALKNLTYSTSIKYISDPTTDIYICSRIPLFRQYVADLLRKGPGRVTVLLIHEQIDVLVELLATLSVESSEFQVEQTTQSYTNEYKKVLNGFHEAAPNFHYTLPPGQADLPLGFEVFILRDTSEVAELHYLSEESVALQQILRFVALKHGAVYAAFSGISSVVNSCSGIRALISSLSEELSSENLHIYDSHGVNVTGDLFLHQLIPLGWDSWSKIEVLAKTIPRSSSRPLISEREIADLNDLYDKYFAGFADSAKLALHDYLRGILEEPKKTEIGTEKRLLTYQDMVQSIQTDRKPDF